MDHLVERLVTPRESDRADAEISAPFDRKNLPHAFQPADALTVMQSGMAVGVRGGTNFGRGHIN